MNLAKAYTPNDYEPSVYALWEKSGVFQPTGQGEPYSVVMPPPNANGNLHVGHALAYSLEDILVRFYRMKGRDAVLLPGADHAGFETWVVYEKQLEKAGKTRFDYTREELYSQIWDFVHQQRGNMELQLRALGVGASWSNMTFTLDPKVINTVYGTFQKLWDDGLIYRGERIVNYCTKHQTSFSDIEVEHKNEKGKLWKIAYPTFDKVGEIIVATTRPETMLGDVAIAVHPDDARYKDLIGTRAVLPLTDREIPIIADEYVDPEYGTGAVKITPAHDPNDFEVGQRHNLEAIQILDHTGKMINVPPQFMDLDIETARHRVLAALEAADLRRGEEEIEHAVGHCYKCGTVIEPILKDQWFLNVKPLAKEAIKALENGKINFTPDSKRRILIQYLKGLRDWNLSRQIPWGIPIPAFQNANDPSDWIFNTSVNEPEIVVNGTTYIREEDTFDTWFSSGQWPFVTTDYLENGDLARFYPNDVMETGGDLLDRWVARMIMLGLYATDKVPFKHVYLHGMVLDENGQKMSKSKGNVVNPIEAVAEYGSDALRIGIISSRSAAQNQAFSTGKIVAGRNFCNKLWNIARYIEGKVGDKTAEDFRDAPVPESLADHWIIERLSVATNTIDKQISEYRFSEAVETMYHAIWDDVADWYIEASKTHENTVMLAWVLDTTLKLAHPFAPFVTETIWQSLSWHDDLLAAAHWPKMPEFNQIAAAEFSQLAQIISEARFVMSELPGNKRYALLYQSDSLIEDNAALVKHLTRALDVSPTDVPKGLRLAGSGRDIYLDIDAETLYEHQSNLEKRLAEVRGALKKLEGRLENKSYVDNAPKHLVEETRKNITEHEDLIARLEKELQVLGD